MISRYSRQEMSEIWSEENKYRIWFEIEAHAFDAQASLRLFQRPLPQRSGKKALLKLIVLIRSKKKLSMM